MSRVFTKNRKELSSIKLLSSDEVWTKDKKGNAKLSSAYNYVGKIDRVNVIGLKF